LSYQWKKGGTDIAGATSSTYTINSLVTADAGNYTVVVTNTKNSTTATATSNSATLAVSQGVSTISLSGGNYTYTGSPQGPDSVTKSGSTGSVTFAYVGRGSTSYTSSATKPTAVGTYTATATLAADSNYASVSASVDFAITKIDLSQPNAPTVTATTATLKSIGVSWTAVSNAASYSLKMYASNGTTLLATITVASGTSKTVTASDYSSIADGTSYKFTLTALGDSTYTDSLPSSLSSSVTTNSTLTITYAGYWWIRQWSYFSEHGSQRRNIYDACKYFHSYWIHLCGLERRNQYLRCCCNLSFIWNCFSKCDFDSNLDIKYANNYLFGRFRWLRYCTDHTSFS
jgi:hypothetical protein